MVDKNAIKRPVRHILSLSGGKDSAALAIYLRDRVPGVEYVFCDTGEELPETYEYLEHLQVYLGKFITVLKNDSLTFTDLLKARGNFLPSPKARWCTEYLKLKPYEKYVGDDICISYIGIRADEKRRGYISSKANISPDYPFIEDGIKYADVLRILERSGVGLPQYYKWRSRSGCYFCFFQQNIEWVGLLESHPDLYWKAAAFEKVDCANGKRYTWNEKESLQELASPERINEIKNNYIRQQTVGKAKPSANTPLIEVFGSSDSPCIICSL